jgi:prepilin-type N-terminal cleavage/methylation domain-containing protein
MRNCNRRHFFKIRHSVIPSSFVIRASSFRAGGAFTLIEILIVIAIILVLAGLLLSLTDYARQKGARARAETEIAALSAALESYKADNGVYPTTANTNALKANAQGNPVAYESAGRDLYTQISGDTDGNPVTPNSGKDYTGSSLKPNMLSPRPPGPNTFIADPFGKC